MCFEDLDKLIRDLKKKHSEICNQWSETAKISYNLDKKYVSDIVKENSSNELFKYILQYRDFLSGNMTDYSFELLNRNLECRIKTRNSIEDKLARYMKKKSQGEESSGKFPLKKCLNDLYGVRYYVQKDTLELDEIKNHLKNTFPDFRIIDASKGDYKAIHVYFHKDNFSFPWELQVWNQQDAALNKESHKKHKQGYTQWEKESQEEK
jgi:hypothetical protein